MLDEASLPVGARLARARMCAIYLARRRRHIEAFVGDIIARPLARREIAVIEQALIGEDDGIARNAEVLCHLAGGWDGLFAGKLAVEYSRNQSLANLRLQARILIAADMNQPIAHRAVLLAPS